MARIMLLHGWIASNPSSCGTWERRRNRDRAGIDWMFTVERAREKLGRAYPAHRGHPVCRPLKAAA